MARRERQAEEPTGAQVEPDAPSLDGGEGQPTGELVSASTGRQKEPKVKVTYSLPVSLARLIDTVAGELGIAPCELVAKLLGPGLKGCRRPTIPNELRGLFPPKGKSAA